MKFKKGDRVIIKKDISTTVRRFGEAAAITKNIGNPVVVIDSDGTGWVNVEIENDDWSLDEGDLDLADNLGKLNESDSPWAKALTISNTP